MKVAICYNRMSGNHNPVQLELLSVAFVDADCDVRLVDSYSAEFSEVANDSDHLCVVGGDGSLRDVVERLANVAKAPTLSIFPAGTINLVAREARYSKYVRKFVERVVAGAPTHIHHHGIANGRPLMVCASIGPDSAAVANLSESLKRAIGRFAYAAAFAQLLLRWPRHAIQVEADGKLFTGEAAFILKGRYFAGPWMLQREADLTAPSFRLLVLPTARRRDYLRLAMSTVIHPAFASGSWHALPATNIKITANTPLPVQVDGDIAAHLPLAVSIAPNALRYC